MTQGPANVSDQLAPAVAMQSLSDQFPPPAVFYKTTTLFNIRITTFSCLAHLHQTPAAFLRRLETLNLAQIAGSTA